MLLRVTPDLSEVVVCAEQAEQENILGASRGTAEPVEVWRCENPVLLTDTARIAQLEPGLEGLELIAKFAQRGRELLADDGLLLLNISGLAGERPLEWFCARGWDVQALDRMSVPLKVNAICSGVTPEARAWYEYLRARGTMPREQECGYRLWHELRIYGCRPRR